MNRNHSYAPPRAASCGFSACVVAVLAIFVLLAGTLLYGMSIVVDVAQLTNADRMSTGSVPSEMPADRR